MDFSPRLRAESTNQRIASAARRAGRLLAYVRTRELDYVVDWRGTVPQLRCGEQPEVRCRRVAEIGGPLPRFAGAPMWVVGIEAAAP